MVDAEFNDCRGFAICNWRSIGRQNGGWVVSGHVLPGKAGDFAGFQRRGLTNRFASKGCDAIEDKVGFVAAIVAEVAE